mgnify:CR=1 FL=1
MFLQSDHKPGRTADAHLPAPLESETEALLRQFLSPIFDAATSWADLSGRLLTRGYVLEFRKGRMVLLNADSGRPVCTGRTMGAPLAQLAGRLGRPAIRASLDGHCGHLHV